MTAPKEILDYLTQPENLSLALDVAVYVEELKRKTHQRFWELLNVEMPRRLIQSDLADKWQFQNFELRRLRTDWEKCYIVPKPGMASHLQYAIGQTSPSNFFLFHGVCWNTDSPGNFDHPQLTHMKGQVLAAGMTVQQHPKWLGWGGVPIRPFSVEFIQGIYARPEEFVKEKSQIIWDKFIQLQPEMELINQLVKG